MPVAESEIRRRQRERPGDLARFFHDRPGEFFTRDEIAERTAASSFRVSLFCGMIRFAMLSESAACELPIVAVRGPNGRTVYGAPEDRK